MAKPTVAEQCRQLIDKRQFKAALTLLEEQPNAFTDKLEYYLLQSETYINLDRGELAMYAAEKAFAMAPINARVLWCRGGAYWRLKKYTEASKDLLEAIAIDPAFAKPHNGLGKVYIDQNEYAKAVEQYELAISKNPDYAIAYYGLGYLYSDQKEYAKAIEQYELAIAKDSDFTHAYNGLGIEYHRKREYAKAIVHFTQAIEKNPQEPLYFRNRGNAYKAIQAYDNAIADYDRALELDPEDYWANQRRNEVLALQGKYKAIETAPEDKEKSSVPVFIKALIDEKLQAESEQIKKQVMKLGSTVAAVVNDIRVLAFKEAREPVAHYTKLLVANIIVNKAADTSKLRYYNVAYMNDPEEGKVLLQMLGDIGGEDFKKIETCFDAGKIREDNNVYLGSFVPVSHQDELVMWRTYGKENNVEASGCSIVIAPNFFDGENSHLQPDFSNSEGKATAAASTDIREKEALYSVVYYNKKKGSEGIIAPKAGDIREGLKKLTEALNDLVGLKNDQPEDGNLASVVNRVVFRTLSEIRYLFKSADYSFENELRVIQYVNGESDRVQIDETGGLPHRLYIESDQSIKPFLQKIILGPKVVNPDQWLYLEVKMKKEKFKLELEKSNVQFQ